MGAHCSSPTLPRVGNCMDQARHAHACGLTDEFSAVQPQSTSLGSNQPRGPSLTQKGLVICVDSVDDLLRALPFELDADLEHLYALPECTMPTCATIEPLVYWRDVGAVCEGRCGVAADNQDNYACVQVDDLANPWGFYAVADGHGSNGHLVSTLLVHELPGLLLGSPSLHRDSSLALYQSFLSVGEMVSTCQYVDASASGSTLTAALLREGLLHVAWVGDSKAVLGRFRARPPAHAATGTASIDSTSSSHMRTSTTAQPHAFGGAPLQAVDSVGSAGQVSFLHAVELTADHIAKDDLDNPRRSSGAGQPGCNAAPGGGTGEAHASDAVEAGAVRPPRGLQRFFGHAASGWQDMGGLSEPTSCAPEVRRMRLKPEDVFVILGTGLWKFLTPADAVAIVGRNVHKPAEEAAAALVNEVERRYARGAAPDDLSVVVLFLQGERFVQEGRSGGAPGVHMLRTAQDHLAGCGCVPSLPAPPLQPLPHYAASTASPMVDPGPIRPGSRAQVARAMAPPAGSRWQ
mmetsp:Transcript_24553/g.68327  ORF Transcript_24553/g.68327 Transcript_24553/m.68327 type:complete len:519 (-) Transcript_24553:35-1591(-)